jgi:hypothetical protein
MIDLLLTASLVTLIWLIQILHYPSFQFYQESDFTSAMEFHKRRISWIVVPLMILEVLSCLWVLYSRPGLIPYANATILALIWLSTFFLQVPLHEKLSKSKEEALIKSLVRGNWIRTSLWSLKFLLLLVGYDSL